MLRRPSPSMVVAVIAVIIALGSTAWAAAVRITTSAQIEDGVILGRDLHVNTLTGTQLKDGSFGANELTSGARNALRGPSGPKGPAGERGPVGDRGPQADTILSNVTYARARITIGPASSAAARATCPGRLVVIGGGVNETSGRSVVTSSGPQGRKVWRASLSNGDAAPHEAIVTAVCAQAKTVR